ncbi:ribosome biogenesis GTP-binding protein YihA/YsxC [Halanaerobium praevalens]|uniref:Probable GTP-binding protein EngB n=1 Tax=Halanaerobium praevalens (strain ATCC 33744 / DSM 2228 / GSL) TaxID=572479 RepID=E3DQ26_HALPG|nr:ribosome biogenesis GTP-binding protein YihA/YsxC [Halanaerobium praevalens]ADO76777.1 ribosome biogenesis GTP-binding protein YsxC [Halanaerobium praevalens DSM 2228]
MKINKAEFYKSVYKYEDCPRLQQPEVAFSGRSNVGKSSLINRMTKQKKLARTSNTPGRTQCLNYFNVDDKFYLVDLPGYGFANVPQKVKDDWAELIDTYLNYRENLVGVVQIIDSRHKPTKDDKLMVNWLQASGLNFLIVATKVDKISNNKRAKQKKLIYQELNLTKDDNFTFFSSQNGEGSKEVYKYLEFLVKSAKEK